MVNGEWLMMNDNKYDCITILAYPFPQRGEGVGCVLLQLARAFERCYSLVDS